MTYIKKAKRSPDEEEKYQAIIKETTRRRKNAADRRRYAKYREDVLAGIKKPYPCRGMYKRDANGLTERQKQIIFKMAEGKSGKQIAIEIGAKSMKIDPAKANIYRKVGVPNAPALIRWAFDHGVLTPETPLEKSFVEFDPTVVVG